MTEAEDILVINTPQRTEHTLYNPIDGDSCLFGSMGNHSRNGSSGRRSSRHGQHVGVVKNGR